MILWRQEQSTQFWPGVTLPPSPGTAGEGRGGGSPSTVSQKPQIRNPEDPHPNPLPEYRAREKMRPLGWRSHRPRRPRDLRRADRFASRPHVAPQHRQLLLGRVFAERLILNAQVAVVAARAEDSDHALQVKVPLVQGAAILAVVLADGAGALRHLRRVVDVLHVRVLDARPVALDQAIHLRQWVAEPVEVAGVQRQAQPRVVPG